ncbi:MAG TPA: hypothetical protein VFS20_23000 [Longimicrobium sp.]|nr:hypothetical protein [Longimicrobium sp.]
MNRSTLLTLALLLSAALPVSGEAQAVLASAQQTAVLRADSVRVLRGARSAQATFERVRFQHLPWTDDSGGRWNCDERIGRFCIWHNDTEEDWRAPPDHRDVVRARDTLLTALARAAEATPGDEWVVGQRVRYLVEGGRAAEAVRAARDCRAEAWWCRALEGYALHFARDYVAAEQAFNAALAIMPAAERREWDALSPALRDDDARGLRRMDEASRDAALRRMWWLADPFWMDTGNDRKTEQYTRLVADRFQDRARTTEGLFWADDLREILLRWGQPTGWERVRPRFHQSGRPSMITHYSPSFEFIPTLEMTRAPLAIAANDWKTDEKYAHSLYAPPGVRRLLPLPHQVAVFPRGSSAEVVAAFAMRPDSLPASPTLDAGLVLMRDPDAAPLVRTARVAGTRGVFRATVVPDSTMVSLEVREPVSERAARARFGTDLRRPGGGGVRISDVLLLEQPGARPQSLDEAAALARGSTSFRVGQRLGLYWEVYGLQGKTDSVTFSVALARRPTGGIRRAAENIGLARTVAPVRLSWNEEAPGVAIAPRSIGISLPRIPPGEYLLEIAVRTRAGASAFAQREIEVTR